VRTVRGPSGVCTRTSTRRGSVRSLRSAPRLSVIGGEPGPEGVDGAAQERHREGRVVDDEALEVVERQPCDGEGRGGRDRRRPGRARDQRPTRRSAPPGRACPPRGPCAPPRPRPARRGRGRGSRRLRGTTTSPGAWALFDEVREQATQAVVAEAGDEGPGRGGASFMGGLWQRAGDGATQAGLGVAEGPASNSRTGAILPKTSWKTARLRVGGARRGVGHGAPGKLGEDAVAVGVEREVGDDVALAVRRRQQLEEAPDARAAVEAAREGAARGRAPRRVSSKPFIAASWSRASRLAKKL
jgi:hypothetical protein